MLPSPALAWKSRAITLGITRHLSQPTICARRISQYTGIANRSLNLYPVIMSQKNFITTTATDKLEEPQIELLTSLSALRAWRAKARELGQDVGFVPTMGALHDGHLSLVRRSMQQNPLTVVSIFVNPAQFAPHEDLATYPRTLDRDLELLRKETVEVPQDEGSPIRRFPSAIFVPSVNDMYPTGITQDVSKQRGAFIQVKGLEEEMEGKSRPGFFRGVATVVLKLFNAVEPTHAYFGQKDIQQALLLRHLTKDILLAHPLPEHLHIVPTTRDPVSGLALSSRNAYLSEQEREWAPTLWKALGVGRKVYEEAIRADSQGEPVVKEVRIKVKAASEEVIEEARQKAEKDGVSLRLDYVELNWADSFEPVGDVQRDRDGRRPVIMSGAIWVGRTRLIDNLILGDDAQGLLQ